MSNVIEIDSKEKSVSKNEPQEPQKIENKLSENDVTEEVSTTAASKNITLSKEAAIELQEEKTNAIEETTQSSINEKQEQMTQAEVKTEQPSTTQKQEMKSPEKLEKTLTTASQEKATKKSSREIATEKSTSDDVVIIDGIKYRAQPNTKITYYCPCYQCSEGYGRGTSSGKTATAGRTVAMPAGVSFGTKIYYNGHIYICEDRGGAITSGHIDIFCDTHYECYQHSDSGTYQTIYIEVK